METMVAKRVLVNNHGSYECPVADCLKVGSSLLSISNHGRLEHGVNVVGPRGRAPLAASRVPFLKEGEDVVIGPTPDDPVIITVENGVAKRRLVTYVLGVGDAVDIIAGALRQETERSGQARRR